MPRNKQHSISIKMGYLKNINTKRESFLPSLFSFRTSPVASFLEAHAARHAAGTGSRAAAAAMAFFLRSLGNHRFGGNQQTRNRSRVLQSRTDNFRRINDTGLDHIGIFAALSIVTEVGIRAFHQFAGHNRTVNAGVFGNLTDRSLNGLADNVYADSLILIGRRERFQSLVRVKQSYAAAGDNAFLDRGTGCVQSIINAVFLFLYFNFRSAADFDYCHTAGNLGQTFLQLFAVIVRRGFLNLFADLIGTGLDQVLLSVTVDNGGFVLGNFNLLAGAEVLPG